MPDTIARYCDAINKEINANPAHAAPIPSAINVSDQCHGELYQDRTRTLRNPNKGTNTARTSLPMQPSLQMQIL